MYLDRLRYLQHRYSCMQEPSLKGLFTTPNCPLQGEGWVGRLMDAPNLRILCLQGCLDLRKCLNAGLGCAQHLFIMHTILYRLSKSNLITLAAPTCKDLCLCFILCCVIIFRHLTLTLKKVKIF